MPPEIGDEWVDRHGVDRSPDAEGKRIDDAYERMVQDKMKADLDRSATPYWPCKWCRMPNGDHHPDCVSLKKSRPVTAAEILRIKMAQQTVTAEQRKAMAMEYEPHIIPQTWKITASTEVFVSDNDGVLRGHRMKKDAVYGTDQVVGQDPSQHPMRFRYPLTNNCEEISTTLVDLVKAGYVVVQTGISRWPYIIVEQKHAIVVYCSPEQFVGEYGATCRKLGY